MPTKKPIVGLYTKIAYLTWTLDVIVVTVKLAKFQNYFSFDQNITLKSENHCSVIDHFLDAPKK